MQLCRQLSKFFSVIESREQGAQRVRKILQHLKEASRYTLEVPELRSHQQAEVAFYVFIVTIC